jgi:hypothetical protein
LGSGSIAKFGGGSDRDFSRPIDASNPFERVPDESGFDLKLSGIAQVLELASAAGSEVRAGRGTADRRGRNYFLHARAGIVLLQLGDSDPEHLPRGRKRNEDDKPLIPCYRFAAIGHAFGGDFYDVVDGNGNGLHEFMIEVVEWKG